MDIEHFKNKLVLLRSETMEAIEKSKDTSKPVELDQTMVGRLSRMDAMQQQEMSLAIKRRREHFLIQIDQAVQRLENEDFGYCIKCNEPIAEKRLDLDPVVLNCVKCSK